MFVITRKQMTPPDPAADKTIATYEGVSLGTARKLNTLLAQEEASARNDIRRLAVDRNRVSLTLQSQGIAAVYELEEIEDD